MIILSGCFITHPGAEFKPQVYSSKGGDSSMGFKKPPSKPGGPIKPGPKR